MNVILVNNTTNQELSSEVFKKFRQNSFNRFFNKSIPLIEEITGYICIKQINEDCTYMYQHTQSYKMYIYVKDRQKMLVLMAMMVIGTL